MEHFWPVKFVMGYEKNITFRMIPESPKVFFSKVEEFGLASFNHSAAYM